MTERHRVSGRRRTGMLLAFLTMATWATLPVALTLTLDYVDPWTLTWFRFLVAAIAIQIWLRRRGTALVRGRSGERHWLLLAVSAATLTANYIFFILGLDLTTPAVAQVLIQVAPVLLGLGSLLLFGERYSGSQWTGFGVLVAGLAIFFRNQLGAFQEDAPRFWLGAALVLIAAITWAAYALTQKQLLSDYRSISVMGFIYLFGAIALFPFTTPTRMLALPSLAWALVGYCALNTLIGYGAFAEALNHWEASRVSAVLALTPFGTIAVVALTAGFVPGALPAERLDWIGLSGAGLAVAGSMAVSLLGGPSRPADFERRS